MERFSHVVKQCCCKQIRISPAMLLQDAKDAQGVGLIGERHAREELAKWVAKCLQCTFSQCSIRTWAQYSKELLDAINQTHVYETSNRKTLDAGVPIKKPRMFNPPKLPSKINPMRIYMP